MTDIRIAAPRRPLQRTARDLANGRERVRRPHPRRMATPPFRLQSVQSLSCFPRRQSSLTVRCSECQGRRTWTLCTLRGASMHVMPEDIDYGVTDDTARRVSHVWISVRTLIDSIGCILKSGRRLVDGDGIRAQAMYNVIADSMLCSS